MIWNVEPRADNQNTYDYWKYAKITPNYALYVHKARVWRSIVTKSGNILSAGEVRKFLNCIYVDIEISFKIK